MENAITMKLSTAVIFSLSLGICAPSFSAVTYTNQSWELVTSTTDAAGKNLGGNKPDFATCEADLRKLPVPARQRTDYCRMKTVVKVVADPVCAPKPADATRAAACPAGTTGSWQQTLSASSAPYPTCWTPGTWSPASPPAGACVTPPPATCDDAAKPLDELRAVQCPGSTTKWWNQTHTSTCVGTTWTATPWIPGVPGVSDCLADPPPPSTDPTILYANPPNANAVAMKPGQSMWLRDGVYNEFALPKCTAAAPCSIAAEHPGAVKITGLNVPWGSYYVTVEGVKYTGAATKVITADHLTFKAVAFEGGPADGNDVSLQIGTNDRTPGASNILIEDSWIYGPGGRYKALVYNADGVVLRRVVARHDGGWKYDGDNPQGGFALYDSRNVICENCMVVDSVQALDGFEAAIYLVSNGTTPTRQTNVGVSGSIVIDSPNNGLAAEGTGTAATYSVTDLIVSRAKAGGVNTNGSGHVLNVIGLTANVSGAAIAKWASQGSLRVTNCKIIKGSTQGATLTTCPGGAGAVVEKRIGADGSMFGEAGYTDLQRDSLWPWPNEARIKADFDSVRPAFGGKSLTEYVKAAQ